MRILTPCVRQSNAKDDSGQANGWACHIIISANVRLPRRSKGKTTLVRSRGEWSVAHSMIAGIGTRFDGTTSKAR